uniref:Uncharacterized protein n=1 Tax=Lactuca sativa TaxID=4236 RepID=A0A9R1WHA0_LACSA|nr:hypothetical protein LSAT_V11C200075170 [Lactuca sativa]
MLGTRTRTSRSHEGGWSRYRPKTINDYKTKKKARELPNFEQMQEKLETRRGCLITTLMTRSKIKQLVPMVIVVLKQHKITDIVEDTNFSGGRQPVLDRRHP